ncbi:MAG: response regulator [Cellulomonadaceae bacterium]
MKRIWSVLVAEDDAMYRATLSTSIAWRDLGCTVVGMVSNGSDAVQVLRNRHVDILLTDVEMPGMDGIELVVRARALQPEIRCLVLSNFDTFDYVKDSLRHGADDYLLKHRAAPSVIEEALRRLCSQGGAPPLRPGESERSSQLELHALLVRDIIRSFLVGGMDGSRRDRVAVAVTPRLASGGAVLLGFSIARYRSHLANLGSETSGAHFISVFLEVCQEAVGSAAFLTDVTETLFAAVVPVELLRSRAARETRLAEVEAALRSAASQYFDAELRVASRTSARTLEHLPEAWAEVKDRLEITVFRAGHAETSHGAGVDGVGPSRRGAGAGPELLDLEEERDLFRQIVSGDCVGVERTVAELFARIAVQRHSRSAALILASDLVNLGIRVCKNRKLSPDCMLEGDTPPPSAIAEAESLDDLEAYVTGRLLQLTDQFVASSPSNVIVQRAVAIIRSRYGEALTVQRIADEIGVSGSHLSRTLNTELGHGFAEELNRTRIEVATNMLEDPELEVKQVARRCGYASYTYFFDVFKKYCGQTPQRYRAELNGAPQGAQHRGADVQAEA